MDDEARSDDDFDFVSAAGDLCDTGNGSGDVVAAQFAEQIEPSVTGRGTRRWVFTINNYDEDDVSRLKSLSESDAVKYIVFGRELAPNTGTHHLQGYIEFSNAKPLQNTITCLKGTSSHHPWVAKARGTSQQCRDYCIKDANYFEKGTISTGQGKRKDLEVLYERVAKSARHANLAAEFVADGDYGLLAAYGRNCQGIDRVREEITPMRPTTADIEVIWLYGPTGSGKTTWVANNYDLSKLYFHPPNSGTGGRVWFPYYEGQDVVYFDDFREGTLRWEYCLNLFQAFPMVVEVKGGFRKMVSTKFIISSCLKPERIFSDINENIWQLKRRITKLIEFEYPAGTIKSETSPKEEFATRIANGEQLEVGGDTGFNC
jgi:hypothetical protein